MSREEPEPRFVSVEEALGWHEVLIAEYGGMLGLRDRGALESALAQPRQAFGGEYSHQFPFVMAAAYAFHISKNHPFVDGNKRVALFCAVSFLQLNGWDLVSEHTEAADVILAVLEGTLDKHGLANWLSEHATMRSRGRRE